MHTLVEKIRVQIEGRGDDFSKRRNAQIAKAITSGVAAKVISMATGLVTIPVTLNYLGIEQFGIWMAISSFVGFLSFTDLGLGFGLQNALSRCHGKDDIETPKYYISNAYFIVIVLTMLVLLTAFAVSHLLPIESMVKVKSAGDTELFKVTFFSVFAISLIGIPISLIQRILTGYQKGNVASILNLNGSILALFSIYISVHFKFSLPVLVTLFISAQLLLNLIYSLCYFIKVKAHRPNFFLINRNIIKEVTSTGFWALIAQFTYLLKVNAPVFILSTNIGMAAVAQYTTTQKLFGIVIMVTTMAVQALWPAYGEAYHRGNRQWMQDTFCRSIKAIAVITIPAFFFLWLAGVPIIEIWTRTNDVLPSLGLLMACNLSAGLSGFNTAFVMVANGTNNFRESALIGLVMTLAAILFAFFVSSSNGSIASTVWVFTVLCDLAPAFFYYQIASGIIQRMPTKV